MRSRIAGWLLALCVAMPGAVAVAESEAADAVSQADWPKQVVVTVGDIRTRIDGPKLWTLSGIDYQNEVMAVQESAYGTVLTIRAVGHLGTAHFLDVPGKPGEIEKEDVASLRFFVDGKPVTAFSPTMDLRGSSFRMERSSRIRSLGLTSTVSIQDGVLIETAHFRATGPIDLQKAHPMMYAWAPGAMVYAWGDDQGIQKRGAFLKEGETQVTQEQRCRWFASFNPTTGKGSVCYVLHHPKDADGWFLLIDAPGVYRKISLYSFVDQVMPTGFEGVFASAVGFFNATEQDWEQRAIERAAELKASAPKSQGP